jgi:cobalt-zinc-cadmium efflux system outer membrane protein
MRKPAQLIGVALLGASLAACARYQSEPLSASANAAALEARSLDGNARLESFIRATLPGKVAGPIRWNLGSLTLAALYFHPDLDIARSKLATARAVVATARQRPNPTLNFGPLYNLSVPNPTPWTVGGVVGFVIETAGKREKRTAQAEALAEAARWDLATAGWQVRGRVRNALLALWSAERRLQLARQREQREAELVALLEQRLAAGQASALDLARERISRAQMDLAIRDLGRAQAEAQVQLASAIGVPARALDGITITFAEFDAAPSPPPALAALRRRALTGRSDVEASLAEYRAADAALRLQIANQYPNLAIGPAYNWGAIDTTRISNQVGLPLNFELPLFHQNQGPIAEAAARRRQAAAGFSAVQAQVIGQVDAAVAAWRAAARTLATADALQGDAERRAARVRESFRAGAVDRPTLVTAELERAVATASRFDAMAAERQALGRLEDALQQPLFGAALRPAVTEETPREPVAVGAGRE